MPDFLHLEEALKNASSARDFQLHIEGLRAVSVMAVAAHHVGIAPAGFLGVDVFFVISGFLITGLLIADFESHGRIDLIAFYARRARRILPLAGLVVVCALLTTAAAGNPVVTRAAGQEGIWASLFGANFNYLQLGTDYFASSQLPLLRTYWSLAVEEQFYLVWPLILILVATAFRSRWRRSATVAAAAVTWASLALALLLGQSSPMTAYFSTTARAWELGIGAVLALSTSTPLNRKLPAPLVNALLVVLVALFLLKMPTYSPALQSLLAVAVGAVLVAGGSSESAGWLGNRYFQYIGSRSYGIYLWHWPVLVIGERQGWVTGTSSALLAVVVAALLADLSYRLYEQPIRSSRFLQRRPGISIAVGAGAVAVAAIASLLAANTAVGVARPEASASPSASDSPTASPSQTPSPSLSASESATPSSSASSTKSATSEPAVRIQELVASLQSGSLSSLNKQVQQVIQGAIDSDYFPMDLVPAVENVAGDQSVWFANGCSVDFADTSVPNCIGGDETATRTIVLYGDSHATMWMPAIDRIAKATGWKVVLFAKLACPLVEEAVWSYQLNKPFDECQTWQAQVLPQIQALHPEVLLVTDQWKPAVKDNAKDDNGVLSLWQRAFPAALERLRSYTDRLVVLGNVPSQSLDPATCIAAPSADPFTCTTLRSDAEFAEVNQVEKSAALAVGGQYISTIAWGCTTQFCPTVIGGRVAYFDRWHYSDTYVAWLEPVMQAALGL